MRIHLQSSHLVAIIAIALFTALMLAIRFRPQSWRGILCEALITNLRRNRGSSGFRNSDSVS